MLPSARLSKKNCTLLKRQEEVLPCEAPPNWNTSLGVINCSLKTQL